MKHTLTQHAVNLLFMILCEEFIMFKKKCKSYSCYFSLWEIGKKVHEVCSHTCCICIIFNHCYGFSLHNVGNNWNLCHWISGTHSQQELKYLRAKTLVIQGWSSDHSQTDVEDVMAKLYEPSTLAILVKCIKHDWFPNNSITCSKF